jgi:hypothetical protein
VGGGGKDGFAKKNSLEILLLKEKFKFSAKSPTSPTPPPPRPPSGVAILYPTHGIAQWCVYTLDRGHTGAPSRARQGGANVALSGD